MSRVVDCENMILQMLQQFDPMSEEAIRSEIRDGCLRAWDRDLVQYILNSLQERNVIRWIAFRGWCLGGRPV